MWVVCQNRQKVWQSVTDRLPFLWYAGDWQKVWITDGICTDVSDFRPSQNRQWWAVRQYRRKVSQSVTDELPFRLRTDDWRKHWNSQKHWQNNRRQKRFSAVSRIVTRIVTKPEQDNKLHKFLCDRTASYVIWLISLVCYHRVPLSVAPRLWAVSTVSFTRHVSSRHTHCIS